jgi:hypothetical protein
MPGIGVEDEIMYGGLYVLHAWSFTAAWELQLCNDYSPPHRRLAAFLQLT